ncbi:MAG: hypothetical protein IJG68_03665 [Bacilli bacterium]|nr:hypothetical protein [Bacilli bacterium]
MDETIGAKGGKNDRKRTRLIQEKKELKEEQELEQKVKKQQVRTFIKSIPIVIGTAPFYFFKKNLKQEPTKQAEEKSSLKQEPNTTNKSIIEDPSFSKSHPNTNNSFKESSSKIQLTPKEAISTVPITERIRQKFKKENIKEDTIKEEIIEVLEEKPKEDNKKEIKYPSVGGEVLENSIEESSDFEELSPTIEKKLEDLKSRRIIEAYEDNLKEIRYELRKSIYEYNVLSSELEGVVVSKEASVILDKLSDLIDKLEELKRKIRIDNLDKYDDNYIYYLIESYFNEFQNGKVIKEIKDSPLFISISSKIEEVKKKQDSLHKSVSSKKAQLEVKEKNFEHLKEKYYSIDQMNRELLSFQYDQEKLLWEIQDKVRNATTVQERVQTEIEGLDRQSRKMLRLLTFQMLLPGAKYAKGVASTTAAYLLFMKNVVKPKMVTKKYQVIMVHDYKDLIMSSIEELEDAKKVLSKTSSEIDKMIKEMNEKYGDYAYAIPEWKELLSNLRRVKQDLEEKKYEMNRLQKEQERELEKNNAKVKTKGEYPVN